MSDPFETFPSHLLTLEDLSGEHIRALFELTRSLRGKELDVCRDRRVVLLFEKPSTRTRVSFEVAMDQLGGRAVYLNRNDIQLKRGESIPDTARTLSRYVQGLVCRTFGHERLTELASHGTVPVINALTDWSHPCQVLADYFTVFEHGDDRPLLVYVGDGNNVCHSLMTGAGLLDLPLRVSTPAGYGPDPDLRQSLRERGADIEYITDPREAVNGADFIYTDVWVSMGDEDEKAERRAAFADYQVNRDLLEPASSQVKVMHCLPAHRGEEITDAVMDGPASIVFEQAENRLHVQKALLAVLVGSRRKLRSHLA